MGDRRVLIAYCDEYMGDFLFDDFQDFFFSRVGYDYQLPDPAGGFSGYVKEGQRLPLMNSPEVFGLHPNAEINYFDSRIRNMWSGLILLQPRTSTGGGGVSPDEFKAQTAKSLESKM